MDTKTLLIAAAILLQQSSCYLPNQGLSSMAESETNTQNFSRLNLGMDQPSVLKIMRSPYSKETFTHEGDLYEIWFYVTKPTVLGQSRMVPQNLTPLTFRNHMLIGWGYEYYNYLVRQEKLEEEKKNPKRVLPPTKPANENRDLEKALKKAFKSNEPQQKAPQDKATKETKEVSMCSRVRSAAKEETTDEPEEENPNALDLDEKDDQMIETEEEQNFDYW
ncbi:MAG: hypothetical protein RL235_890 [Chlamydiota bacterium]|jgi:outer membrane protein assembly factor BamE (lipoprotein component of BamABCDE complex)